MIKISNKKSHGEFSKRIKPFVNSLVTRHELSNIPPGAHKAGLSTL